MGESNWAFVVIEFVSRANEIIEYDEEARKELGDEYVATLKHLEELRRRRQHGKRRANAERLPE